VATAIPADSLDILREIARIQIRRHRQPRPLQLEVATAEDIVDEEAFKDVVVSMSRRTELRHAINVAGQITMRGTARLRL